MVNRKESQGGNVKRGNLYSFFTRTASSQFTLDTPLISPTPERVIGLHVEEKKIPNIRSISSSLLVNKDKYIRNLGDEELEKYFKNPDSAFPADRKFGGSASARIMSNYEVDQQQERDNAGSKNSSKKKAKLHFDDDDERSEEVVNAEDIEKQKIVQEADKLLNSGISYLKMKKMKSKDERAPEITIREEILRGGTARVIEAQHNRDVFRDIQLSNLRGEMLTTILTQKMNETLEIKEKQLNMTIEDNLDIGKRGEFINAKRKAVVQASLKNDISDIYARKEKIESYLNTNIINSRSALLFGDDDSSVESARIVETTGLSNAPTVHAGPPTIRKVSRIEASWRAHTPNAAMKRESVRRGVIPFGIKELVASAVRMEGQKFGKERVVRVEGDDEEGSLSYGENNDIVSINVADYGLGDDKAACLAEAIKLCPNITYLNIQGNRLTDAACEPILKAVLHVGTVRTLVLSNNKLDALSIDPLRENIARLPKSAYRAPVYNEKELLSIELGGNKYEDRCLVEVLPEIDMGCSIEDLRLCQSDIDDEECAEFMKAVQVNKSLKKLDLSHNLIGDREEECAVFPSFTTGGRAIARMLTMNTTLVDLNLSWNKIRKDSALVLVKCLSQNKTLTSLNLSSNNIGDIAVQHLANALRQNTSMIRLDVSYNGIMPKGTLVMAHALEENRSMIDCSFEGNCIGESGGKALLRAMRQAAEKKRQLRINFNNCNMHWEDHTLFNRHEPKQGPYLLHLDDPYDYMIGRILFEISNNSFGAKFTDVKHRTLAAKLTALDAEYSAGNPVVTTTKSGTWEKVELKRPDATGNFNAAWDVHLYAINEICERWESVVAKKQQDAPYAVSLFEKLNAKLIAAVITLGFQLGLNVPVIIAECISKILFNTPSEERSKIHMIFKVIFRVCFRVVDEDQSFSVDEEELSKSLALLGVSFANDKYLCLDYARRMIAGVDVDGDKSLDEGEFVRMMLVSYTETIPQSPEAIVDISGRPWTIPTTGDLQFVFRCEKLPPSLEELQSDDTVAAFSSNLTTMEGTDEAKEANLALTVSGDTFFTCEQAEMLLLAFPRQKGGTQNSQIIEMFLPQMTTTVEVCKFLAQNMNVYQIFELRRRWGAYFSAVTGLATGHYFLDMNLEKDRKAARRLAMLNSLQKSKAQVESSTRDTSQNGNVENYRNACMNFSPFDCTSYFFAEMPVAGRMSFDFVSITRPVPGVEASSPESINKLIERVFHADLEKYNVFPEFKMELDEEFTAKLQAEKEAEEAAQRAIEEEEERERLEEIAKKAAEAGRSPPKKISRKFSLAMQASAQMQQEEALEKLKKAQETPKVVDSSEKSKYVTLLETTALKKNEENLQIWNSFIDTSYCQFKRSYLSDLNDKLLMARIDEGLSSSFSSPEEEIEAQKQAMQNKIFRDHRLVPVHKANLALYLKREKQRIATQIRETEKANARNNRKNKKATKAPKADAIDVDEFEKRKQLLRRCLSFEHNLNMLEASLVYNMYLSAEQANAIVQVFIERRAPVEVIIKCICILFARIVDLQNLEPHLFSQLTLPRRSLETLLDMPKTKESKAQLEIVPLDPVQQALADDSERLLHIHLVRREVYHRLGMLNVWCPMYPDGMYELDLAAKDHNEVFKLLLRLAIIEPGPHIIDLQYSKSMLEPCRLDKSGKWCPPATWMDGLNAATPAAIPKFGEIRLKYSSADDAIAVLENTHSGPDNADPAEGESGHLSTAPSRPAPPTVITAITASGAVPQSLVESSRRPFEFAPTFTVSCDPTSEGTQEADPAEVVYRQNLDARKELTRLKTLAGAQGTFIQGWVDGQQKLGVARTVPELVKLSPSVCQQGFSYVSKGEIEDQNITYILETVSGESTFHDEVNTMGLTKSASLEAKNPYFTMLLSAAHIQDI